MSFADFFASYWWLMFPIFGLAIAVLGMFSSERRNARIMDLIKSYVDQGKDPPPELLKLAAQDDYGGHATPETRRQRQGWTFITFAAMAAGFTTGWWFVRGEDSAFAFLTVAVVMGVMAVGALFLLLAGRK